MGNTIATTNSVAAPGSMFSDDETERLFREKIGYISIIKNRKIRRNGSRDSASHGGIPGDLVSSLKGFGDTQSWVTGNTSMTSEVTGPTPTCSRTNPDQKVEAAIAKIFKEISLSKSSTKSDPHSAASSISGISNMNSQSTRGGRLPPTQTSTTQTSTKGSGITCLNSYVSQSSQKIKPTSHHSGQSSKQVSRQSSKSTSKMSSSQQSSQPTSTKLSSQPTSSKLSSKPRTFQDSSDIPPFTNSNAESVQKAGSNPDPMTESLLRELQKKMAIASQEQDACLQQINTMNQDMESYRTDTAAQLKEKDETINKHEAQIASLEQLIVHLKTEHQEEQSAAHTETRGLLRKVTKLQNHLMVAEQQRDAAVNAIANSDDTGSSISSHKEEELKETIQDLLKQLEQSENVHQEEQKMLNEENFLLRKKLDRLESQYIVIEREREDALQKLQLTQQKLEGERSVTQSDLKQYQEEVSRWKDQYDQELRYSNNRETENMLQKTAVVMSNRLTAGILEGIQEDEELVMTEDHNGVTTARLDDESSTYSRLVSRLRSESSSMNAPMMEITNHNSYTSNTSPSMRSQMGFEVDPRGLASPNNIMGAATKIPTSHSGTFDESMSIPSFLSQVW